MALRRPRPSVREVQELERLSIVALRKEMSAVSKQSPPRSGERERLAG